MKSLNLALTPYQLSLYNQLTEYQQKRFHELEKMLVLWLDAGELTETLKDYQFVQPPKETT